MPDNKTPSTGIVTAATDPSKFCINHSDYAGMTASQKRRKVTRLLRQCNMFVLAEQISIGDIGTVRGNVENAQAWTNAETNAVHDGIIWVRCPQPGLHNAATGGRIRAGWPVIFDAATGNSVTGLPTQDSFMGGSGSDPVNHAPPVLEFNFDEYEIVGYALADPIKNASSDFWQLPIRLHRQWNEPQGTFKASTIPTGTPYMSDLPPSNNIPTTTPRIYPATDQNTPSWRELRVIAKALRSPKTGSGKYTLSDRVIAERGIIVNPYPWSYGTEVDGLGFEINVQRSGDVFVVSPNQNCENQTATTLSWNEARNYDPGVGFEIRSLGITPYSPLIKASTSSYEYRWLPTYAWRFRLIGFLDIWTYTSSSNRSLGHYTPEVTLGNFGVPYSTGTPSGMTAHFQTVGSIPDATVYYHDSLASGVHYYRTPISCVLTISPNTNPFKIMVNNFPSNPGVIKTVGTAGHITIEPVF